MYKVWLITDRDSSRIIPKNQPVVADSKMKVGNGKNTYDELPYVGAAVHFERAYYGAYGVETATSGIPGVNLSFTDVNGQIGSSTDLVVGEILETSWLGLTVVRIKEEGIYTVNAVGQFAEPSEACVQGIALGSGFSDGVTPKTEAFSPAASYLHTGLVRAMVPGDVLWINMYQLSGDDLDVAYAELDVARLM